MTIFTKNIKQYTIEVTHKKELGRWYGKIINNNAKLLNQIKENYYFNSEDSAMKWAGERAKNIEGHFARIEARAEERRQARKNFVNPAKKGDILYSSWGYDQTNIDFYQVIGVTKASVKVREIAKEFIGSEPGSDIVKPAINNFKGDLMTKRVKPSSDGYAITLNSYSSAFLHDGQPKRQTDAWSGH